MLLPNQVEDETSNIYDIDFFADHLKHREAFNELGRTVFNLLYDGSRISNVDIGCGHGLFVEALRQAGLYSSFGLEGSSSAVALWPTSQKHNYWIAELRDESTIDLIPPTEMVTSFETAEHLPEEYADQLVKFMVCHNPKLIIFGAATWLQDQGRNITHYNEMPYHYWIKKFKNHGYKLDILTTVSLRNTLFKSGLFGQTWWYPKNILLFYPQDIAETEMIYKTSDISILDQGLIWFEIQDTDDMFSLMLLRDYCEYKLLAMEYLYAG